jgi:hypothetical protein
VSPAGEELTQLGPFWGFGLGFCLKFDIMGSGCYGPQQRLPQMRPYHSLDMYINYVFEVLSRVWSNVQSYEGLLLL